MTPLFLDTETTGIAGCRLVEIAFASLEGAIEVFRVRPPIPIEESARMVHGITNEDVAGLPLFAEHPEYGRIKELMEGNLVVAHNASFDVGVLEREGIDVRNSSDTKTLARFLHRGLPSYSLQALRAHFDISTEGQAHSAAGDVAVLRELYKRLECDRV